MMREMEKVFETLKEEFSRKILSDSFISYFVKVPDVSEDISFGDSFEDISLETNVEESVDPNSLSYDEDSALVNLLQDCYNTDYFDFEDCIIINENKKVVIENEIIKDKNIFNDTSEQKIINEEKTNKILEIIASKIEIEVEKTCEEEQKEVERTIITDDSLPIEIEMQKAKDNIDLENVFERKNHESLEIESETLIIDQKKPLKDIIVEDKRIPSREGSLDTEEIILKGTDDEDLVMNKKEILNEDIELVKFEKIDNITCDEKINITCKDDIIGTKIEEYIYMGSEDHRVHFLDERKHKRNVSNEDSDFIKKELSIDNGSNKDLPFQTSDLKDIPKDDIINIVKSEIINENYTSFRFLLQEDKLENKINISTENMEDQYKNEKDINTPFQQDIDEDKMNENLSKENTDHAEMNENLPYEEINDGKMNESIPKETKDYEKMNDNIPKEKKDNAEMNENMLKENMDGTKMNENIHNEEINDGKINESIPEETKENTKMNDNIHKERKDNTEMNENIHNEEINDGKINESIPDETKDNAKMNDNIPKKRKDDANHKISELIGKSEESPKIKEANVFELKEDISCKVGAIATKPPPMERVESEDRTVKRQSLHKMMWSEMPEVIESEILKYLSKKQIQLQEAMFEIIRSEASYFSSLMILTTHFFDSELFKIHENKEILVSSLDKHHIFSNVILIMSASQKFLNDLEQRWLEEKPQLTQLCDIILKHVSGNDFQNYVTYLRNQEYQSKALKRLTENEAFRQQLNKLENSPVCGKLPMDSYLMLPMQRITRLKLLVDAILKLMYCEELRNVVQEEHINTAEMTLLKLKQLLDTSDFEKGFMDQKSTLLQLMNKMDFPPSFKRITISDKYFIKEDELRLHQQNPLKNIRKFTKKRQPTIRLILFNDLLILAKKKALRLMVIDYCDRNNIEASETRYKSIVSSMDVSETSSCVEYGEVIEEKERSNTNTLSRSKTSISSDDWKRTGVNFNNSFKSMPLINRGEEQEILNNSFSLRFIKSQTDIFNIPIVFLAKNKVERDEWMALLSNPNLGNNINDFSSLEGKLQKTTSLRQSSNRREDFGKNKNQPVYSKKKDDDPQLPN